MTADSPIAPPAMIETSGLGRQFGSNWAVRDLSLRIAAGELYGFLGQNGAGKTTTIRMLTGVLRPSAGRLRIAGLGHDDGATRIKQITGLVPDTPPLYDYLTGRQYVALVASLWRIDRRTRDQRCERLFDLLGLTASADQLCKGYSHGMRKKVHIAAVLTTAPRVLLLDEPTTGLDPLSTRRFKDLLLEQSRLGTTILLSTHVLDVAAEICDRIGILADGRLRCEGTPAELIAAHGGGSFEDVFLKITAAAAGDARGGTHAGATAAAADPDDEPAAR
ncbi:MAG: ABC transporter ATP-binding protein [Planctomycetes bacterium]|nr:ABC transporter ATP-binding protein [Planctomycetota bacterium]